MCVVILLVAVSGMGLPVQTGAFTQYWLSFLAKARNVIHKLWAKRFAGLVVRWIVTDPLSQRHETWLAELSLFLVLHFINY